jgi:small subunit ribosomal protein S5
MAVTRRGSTIPHEVVGKLESSRVLLRPAPKGTGVIAGGAVRIVLELAGISDVVGKLIGSPNAINSARATLVALSSLKNKEEEEEIRGKKLDIRFVQEDA